jgi:diguanylate cyclase (GGDEF)-like protein
MQNEKNDRPVILAVDDTEINIDFLVGFLSNQYELIVALDAETALEVIEEESIDLILLDIMMPEMDGYTLCQKLKSNSKTKNIPVIFITAKTDDDSIEKAFEVGGIDYVSKPFRPRELLARIKTQLRLNSLIKDLEKSKQELKILASTDPLTSLYNRRYFAKVSEHILDLSKRDNKNLSLIMLDIDYFKNINDSYGHKTGDNVLVAIAKTLNEQTRKSDIICRFGGEEFIILLPETDLDGAIIIAEKIRLTIENFIFTIDTNSDQMLKYTASFGVTEVNLIDKKINALVSRADIALYKAKEGGRNRVCHF